MGRRRPAFQGLHMALVPEHELSNATCSANTSPTLGHSADTMPWLGQYHTNAMSRLGRHEANSVVPDPPSRTFTTCKLRLSSNACRPTMAQGARHGVRLPHSPQRASGAPQICGAAATKRDRMSSGAKICPMSAEIGGMGPNPSQTRSIRAKIMAKAWRVWPAL